MADYHRPMRNPAAAVAPPSSSSKTATIARVLDAARREFSEKGIAGARMDEIARAAGVTKQLVYHYFSGKEQLFACVLDAAASTAPADHAEVSAPASWLRFRARSQPPMTSPDRARSPPAAAGRRNPARNNPRP